MGRIQKNQLVMSAAQNILTKLIERQTDFRLSNHLSDHLEYIQGLQFKN